MGIIVNPEDWPVRPNVSLEGVRFSRSGEALETVRSKISTVGLLETSPNVEIMHVDLEHNGRVTLMPSGDVTETFYLVSGQLSATLCPKVAILRAGDSVTTENLNEPVVLTALTNAKLMYITSKPQFHLLSEHLQELQNLAIEVEIKDGYTADHCDRLQSLSYATARELELPAAQLLRLDYGSYLHDVGKLHIPLSILNKPGKLTPTEWDVIKKHPGYGRELIDKTFMKEAGLLVEQHHERSDGSGYPYGLSGDEITIEASIIAVADTFDAMTTKRPYAPARTENEAVAELWKYAGIHYPKDVVNAFCSSLKKAVEETLTG